mmetsp:Transcript_70712/g.166742  ORF Transcript_70712/g.166742 Transcript_70712/m.166742 type:complete len:126 (-) Transcript_70712:916-1293(-)
MTEAKLEPDLSEAEHVLLEGFLQKKSGCAKSNVWKTRHIVLTNRRLFYYKSRVRRKFRHLLWQKRQDTDTPYNLFVPRCRKCFVGQRCSGWHVLTDAPLEARGVAAVALLNTIEMSSVDEWCAVS